MPDSALAHLEDRVYLVPEGTGLKTVLLNLILLVFLTVVMLAFPLLILTIPPDPISIAPGLKELMVLIFMAGLFPFVILSTMLGWHNLRRTRNVVLALKPSIGRIGWEVDGSRLELTKEDFVQINAQVGLGRAPEVVWEFCLRDGQKLYLSLVHPGLEAILAMLKGIPVRETESRFPIIPARVPRPLLLMRSVLNKMSQNYVYEGLAILFCLCAGYALYYYEKNQRILGELLPEQKMEVLGHQIKRGSKGRKIYYLWITDGRQNHDVRVPRATYETSMRSRSVQLFYNHYTGRYVYQSTDLGPIRFVQCSLAGLIVFLTGRILWLSLRRRRERQAMQRAAAPG